MTFQNPGALAWLLPLGGIIIALYLLKMTRRDLRVPATFLWPAQTDEVRANTLFQRLKPSWLLFLQLLALTLAIAALARPQTVQRGLTGTVTVLLIDCSASMSATDVQPSRFEEARRLAREAIEGARPSDRIALIEAGPTPRVVFPLGSDSRKQLRALAEMVPTDAEADMGEALRLAGALVGSQEGARIVLLSDGVFDRIEDFSRGKATFTYRSIGKYADNLAINALGVTETSGGKTAYVGIRNTGPTALEGAITLYGDGKVIDSFKTGPIAPKGQWGKSMGGVAGAQVLEAKLETSDVLKSDNYAVTLDAKGASLKVLLVGKGDPFLERALALDPRVTLDRTDEVPASERGNGEEGAYDIVVFDGVPPVPVRARGVLSLGQVGQGLEISEDGASKAPKFISAEPVPLLRGVQLDGLFVDRQVRVAPKGESEVLALSSGGPLVVVNRSRRQRQVFLAFAPLDSDFPLQVGFPIFIGNALDFLAGEQMTSDFAVRAGVPFSVSASSKVTLSDAAGRKTELKPVGTSVIVRGVKRVGKYQLTAGKKPRTIYSYLRSERESDLAPQKLLSLGGGSVAATESPSRFADFWRPLVMLMLLALAGEWWLFARRS